MDADLVTAISQAAGISGIVIAVLWTKFRGLDKLVTALDDSVGELRATTAVGNERLDQIEKRLGGNGHSVPSQCGIHDEKLDNLDRRVSQFE